MDGMEEEDGMEGQGRVGWVREKGWRSIQEEDGEERFLMSGGRRVR
jgi:hypothetical protein